MGSGDHGAIGADGQGLLNGVERRRHSRHDFKVPVFMRVLIEEETFQPFRFPGQSRNVSTGGILIEIKGVSEEHHRMMVRRRRMVRVHVQVPEEGEVVFFGKMAWYDCRRNSGGSSCLVGVAFETLGEKERAILANVLQRLEATAADSANGEPRG